MGYKLTSLANLPIEEHVNLYIFSIGDGIWEGGLQDLVNKNFDALAREIGPDAIIVGGLEFEFHGEVVEKYFGVHHRELKNELPALLITDSHPENLTEESMRLLVPLGQIQDKYQAIDLFLSDLAAFACGKSDELLKVLESEKTTSEHVKEIVNVRIPIIPGFLAVNVNNTIPKLRNWWNEKFK